MAERATATRTGRALQEPTTSSSRPRSATRSTPPSPSRGPLLRAASRSTPAAPRVPPRAFGRPRRACGCSTCASSCASGHPTRSPRGARPGATAALALLDRTRPRSRVEVAADPFFGRAGRMLRARSASRSSSWRSWCHIAGPQPTAVASLNLHREHFADAHGIRLASGAAAHTACLASGTSGSSWRSCAPHGLDPRGWPAGPRRELGSRDRRSARRGASIRPLYLEAEPHTVFGLFHPARARGDGPRSCSARRSAGRKPAPTAPAWSGPATSRNVVTHPADRPAGHRRQRRDAEERAASAGPRRASSLRWTGCACTSPTCRSPLIGIELGGLLALLAVAAGARIDELVLWGTRSKGSAWVRELRAMGSLEPAPGAMQRAPEPPPLPDGAVSAGGFVLGRPRPAPPLERRSTSRHSAAVRASSGGHCCSIGTGWRRTNDSARRAGRRRRGLDAARAGVRRVGDRRPADRRDPRARRSRRRPRGSSTAPATASLRTAPEGRRSAPGPRGHGARVREAPFVHDVRRGRLFGILAEPGGPPADLCAVLLNAGPQRRVGPNRMWVQSARRWAACGVPSLRIDLDGIGDADGRPAGWRERGSVLRAPARRVRQGRAGAPAHRGIRAAIRPIGFCSGANWPSTPARRRERRRGDPHQPPRPALEALDRTDRETRKFRSSPAPRCGGGSCAATSPAPIVHPPGGLRPPAPRPWEALERVQRRGAPDELDAALARLAGRGTSVHHLTDQVPLHDELSRPVTSGRGRHCRSRTSAPGTTRTACSRPGCKPRFTGSWTT